MDWALRMNGATVISDGQGSRGVRDEQQHLPEAGVEVTSANWLRLFFFSSRRRHTRLQGDWSSDVCSSDLERHEDGAHLAAAADADDMRIRDIVCGRSRARGAPTERLDEVGGLDPFAERIRREIGRASCREKSVDLGGRRIIKKKKKGRRPQ